MSSPNRNRRRLLTLGLLLPLLSGCSFSPLYGGMDSSMSAGTGFAYAEPNNRYEQIIYQELAFRLGTDSSPTPDWSQSAPLNPIAASAAPLRARF